MSNQDYLYHRCLFYIGYEVLQTFPQNIEVLEVTFKEGVCALSALEEKKDYDLAQKVYELSQQRKQVVCLKQHFP